MVPQCCLLGEGAGHSYTHHDVSNFHSRLNLQIKKLQSHTTLSFLILCSCPLSDAEGFKCGKFPLRAPSNDYAMTLVRGLVEGGQFPEDEAVAYIEEAASKPL